MKKKTYWALAIVGPRAIVERPDPENRERLSLADNFVHFQKFGTGWYKKSTSRLTSASSRLEHAVLGNVLTRVLHIYTAQPWHFDSWPTCSDSRSGYFTASAIPRGAYMLTSGHADLFMKLVKPVFLSKAQLRHQFDCVVHLLYLAGFRPAFGYKGTSLAGILSLTGNPSPIYINSTNKRENPFTHLRPPCLRVTRSRRSSKTRKN